jgi:hypothetical protein
MNALQKVVLTVVLGAGALLPTVQASEWSQRTTFTFSGPVEIPGQVLPAGTYVFKLADSNSYRHIVQVFNKEENYVFGTFLTIPTYRQRPSEKSIIKFEERAGSAPDAIKMWFYPGRISGHEFVYPKQEALALAQANRTPVPFMPNELTPDTTNHSVKVDGPEFEAFYAAPLKVEKPTGEVVELAQVVPPAAAQTSAPSAELPQELPATATSLPLIALLGLLSLGATVTLRLAAKTR